MLGRALAAMGAACPEEGGGRDADMPRRWLDGACGALAEALASPAGDVARLVAVLAATGR